MQLEENNTVGIIFDAFENHFIGKTNETYERYVFNKRDQKTDELAEDYIAVLHTLAATCNCCYCLKDSLPRDGIVFGMKDSSTRKWSLQEGNFSLKTITPSDCIASCLLCRLTPLAVLSPRNLTFRSWLGLIRFRPCTVSILDFCGLIRFDYAYYYSLWCSHLKQNGMLGYQVHYCATARAPLSA